MRPVVRIIGAAQHVQHMQKALEEMNVKLTEVVSDIVGQTGLKIIKDIEFVKRDGQALAGDFYLPANAVDVPCIIAVHGGAWQRGGPKSYARLGPYLARHGIALFAVTYRFAPKNRYPAAVQDIRAAVQFIRSKGNGMGIDTKRLCLMGDSAGGHLASLVAPRLLRFLQERL